MRKLFLLLQMSSIVFVANAQDNVIDEVIWVVGDQAILKSEVEERRIQALYQGEKIEGDPYCVIPEDIAIQKLFLNQAKIDSVSVPESQVSQYVDFHYNSMITRAGSKEKLEEYQRKSSVKIREQMRELLRDQLTVEAMQQKIVGEIKITPVEVRKYYEKLPVDSLPFIPTQVEVQILTYEPKPTMQETDAIKARLRDFTERINRGEIEFSTLAIAYSEDKESAKIGGELGFMGKASLVPEFANVAFGLQDPKKVSQIVETEFGFHIMQLIERRGDRVNVRHILLKPKVETKAVMEALSRLDSIAADIKSKKFTFEEAASVISQDKDSRNNNGLMANPATGTSRFEMQQLPQEIAKVVDTMNPGDISKAISAIIDERTGKTVCLLVKLKARYPGHRANVAADYQELRDIVRGIKAQEVITKWIREKQRATYIRINPNWSNCEFKYPGWIKE